MPHFNAEHIRRTLGLLDWGPHSCNELRALGVRQGNWFTRCVSGYFDDLELMARAAEELSGRAEGVYFCLNPIRRELLCRAKNRLEWRPQFTTSDADVLRRRLLLVDFDPVRPKGVSATDAELRAAVKLTVACRNYLREKGFKGLTLETSGNGAHILVPMDEPNDEENRVRFREVLGSLSHQFSEKAVVVDTATHNASRICKLYGTLACKGDHCPEEGRPHRIARLLEVDGE
jgi:hypothetical protein